MSGSASRQRTTIAGQIVRPVGTAESAGEKPALGPASDSANAGLQLLLRIERDARRCGSLGELQVLVANETRRAIGARQVFLLRVESGRSRVESVSSVSSVERHAPLIDWIEACCHTLFALEKRHVANRTEAGPQAGPLASDLRDLPASALGKDTTATLYPFPHALFGVLRCGSVTPATILAVRETPFGESETLLLQRLVETYAHAWAALGGASPSLARRARRPATMVAIAALVALAGFIPVPMLALAPVEVVALEPAVIAAPIDGSIETIPIEPNQAVQAGTILFRYADTQARGALDIAERDMLVAEARLRQATQMAFVDPAAKREIAVARTELRLKRAEHAFAGEMHARTVMRSPRDGVAIFADKRDLIGRPVAAGQRVMEIADPTRTQFRLNVPADDALVLREDATARIFMDADPLNPLAARIVRAAPMVRQSESGALVFRAEARIEGAAAMPPLGHRGTAQISGEQVSLAFYLFRRPIAALRQKTGL